MHICAIFLLVTGLNSFCPANPYDQESKQRCTYTQYGSYLETVHSNKPAFHSNLALFAVMKNYKKQSSLMLPTRSIAYFKTVAVLKFLDINNVGLSTSPKTSLILLFFLTGHLSRFLQSRFEIQGSMLVCINYLQFWWNFCFY